MSIWNHAKCNLLGFKHVPNEAAVALDVRWNSEFRSINHCLRKPVISSDMGGHEFLEKYEHFLCSGFPQEDSNLLL